jgi:hypothetical protein
MSRVSKSVLRLRTIVPRSNAAPPRRPMTALFAEVVNCPCLCRIGGQPAAVSAMARFSAWKVRKTHPSRGTLTSRQLNPVQLALRQRADLQQLKPVGPAGGLCEVRAKPTRHTAHINT